MRLPIFSYISQFSSTSPLLLATEARMMQRLTACPRFTFGKEAPWSLEKQLQISSGMQDGCSDPNSDSNNGSFSFKENGC